MTLGAYSCSESYKQMDPIEKSESVSIFEDRRMKTVSKMVLCGHKLFSPLRFVYSSVRSKRSIDVFSEDVMAEKGLRSSMKKQTVLTDQYCSQSCSFKALLSFC
ncbi:unnamed protein product [Lepeophtheirus salmonis]|uniref:(salmon louse) hypothetical protein n=1 Tax=Lepeophtheirus salmonis TaxID=72036 RepID=A0A7R8CX57_LEPSM|nr:unnamed protein product [Lepeophtheirus salmonis]CAF2957309.1 unnamed protein product [Lepeophtheirus salmonis]